MSTSDDQSPSPLNLLVTDPGREVHYQPVFDYLQSSGLEVIVHYPTSDWSEIEIDLALTSCEYNTASALEIAKAKSLGIATLHIVDGITEWRNTWENPRSESEDRGMPMFQPILSDKIACIGPSQGRLFCSWGQAEKVEITGLPRLDDLIAFNPQTKPRNGEHCSSLKLVIATARTPGFTPDQVDKVRASLQDINDYLVNSYQSQSVTIVWRVGMPEILPVDYIGVSINESTQSLSQALDGVSALITTPSTLALEAMAMQIPTCILDYTNSPAYLQAAWRITCKDHINGEINSITSRDCRRMTFQNYLLHDQLRIDSPAAPRTAKLIIDMVHSGRLAKQKGSKPRFKRFLAQEYDYHSARSWDPSGLFPAHPIFTRSDLDEINAELGHLRLMLKCKEPKNESRGNQWNARSIGAMLSRAANKLLFKSKS
jgi:septum formation topological specificity factor MinE